jgi:hypothetical protein
MERLALQILLLLNVQLDEMFASLLVYLQQHVVAQICVQVVIFLRHHQQSLVESVM